MKKVSTIFKEKPEKWGLRGDPYFWEYLEDIFNNYEERIGSRIVGYYDIYCFFGDDLRFKKR